MRIGICGAGIGGLAAAAGLVSLGLDVIVFERSDALRVTGAGLNLWPNAGRAIYGLGLRERYDMISKQLDCYLNYDPDGNLMFEKDTSLWPVQYGAASVGAHRLALTEMLADAAGRERIKFGYQVVSVESRQDQAVCHFGNGESAALDAVIAADGIHSVIRGQLAGGVRFRPNPHHAHRWRAVLDKRDVDVHPAAQTGYYAPGGWLAVIPLGNEKTYWFGSVTGAASVDDFIRFFSGWKNTHIPNTLRITPRARIIESPLVDVEGLPERWTFGRVTLLGDAAHPMMPDLAQGASQALLDALALRDAFANTKDVADALRNYEAQRKESSYAIVRASSRGSFMGRNKVDPIAVRYEREVEGSA